MQLSEASKKGVRLTKIECSQVKGLAGFSSLCFLFEDGSNVTIGVDPDTDEIIYRKMEDRGSDIRQVIPGFETAYGLSLVWSWEMRNQQGYFDAIQLELANDTMSRSVVLQFKVAASMIRGYTVESRP